MYSVAHLTVLADPSVLNLDRSLSGELSTHFSQNIVVSEMKYVSNA